MPKPVDNITFELIMSALAKEAPVDATEFAQRYNLSSQNLMKWICCRNGAAVEAMIRYGERKYKFLEYIPLWK